MYNIASKVKGEKLGGAKAPEGQTSTVTDGFFRVVPSLWKHIPPGSLIQYIRVQKKGESLEKDARWRPRGYVKQYLVDNNGVAKFNMSVCRNGKDEDKNYGIYAITCENIEELWKKCAKDSCVEIYLINATIAKQKKQIELLTLQVQELTQTLSRIVNERRV